MNKKYKIIAFILLVILILSSMSLYSWYRENKETKKIVSTVSEYLTIEDEVYEVNDKILTINKDTIGWLIVDNTNINYPVVKYNNTFYLNHDFNKKRNSAGWIFMDGDNKLDDQNIIIYGHHRRDGSMFGSIDKLFNDKGGKVLLVVNGENRYYQIFSVYRIEDDELYITKNFDNFNDTLETFKNRSKYDFRQDLGNVEQIITLSTCSNDNKGRLVVHAYRNLRKGL